MRLRPYQDKLIADVRGEWSAGRRNVVMCLATGGGKTPVIAKIISEWQGGVAAIAHRHELVSQLSCMLASFGIRHNIIASDKSRREIVALHILRFGRTYFEPGSRIAVVSVDTLARAKNLDWWFGQVTLWVVDEGHHLVEDNKWHRAIERFPNPHVHGLLPTATPNRADGKGLGRHADGVADALVEGPPMRWLIGEGYLTDYQIYCPPCDLEVLENVAASGDWSSKALKEAAARSHIVGDVVTEYLRYAPGQKGITFMTDVDAATSAAQAYRDAGVRAEVLHGETQPGFRAQIIKNLETGRLDQLVAVDIVSEGFDLPAVQVGSFGRPSQSYPLFAQQFGRLVRPMFAAGYDLETRDGRLRAIEAGPKPIATVIDHVANTLRHQGPPDKPRVLTLDRRERRGGAGGAIPLITCGSGWTPAKLEAAGLPLSTKGCFRPFEKTHTACPYCGLVLAPPTVGGRSSPAAVDGDLYLLDGATLAALRGDVDAANQPIEDYSRQLAAEGWTGPTYMSKCKQHNARREALDELREAMGAHGWKLHAAGFGDREIQKDFMFRFGIDVLSAQALNRADAATLTEKVWDYVRAH